MIRRAMRVLALLVLAPSAYAAKCSVDLQGDDSMQFNLSSIEVSRSCKTFTIRLAHTGKLPRNAMGHNVVVAKADDVRGVDADGIRAGLAADYVKPNDGRVVAHSKVVGGGESATLAFDPAKLDAQAAYAFFCSFPGHSALMRGTLKLVP